MSVDVALRERGLVGRDGLAQTAAALGVSLPTIQASHLAWAPARFAQTGPATRPDIQYAIDDYIGPAVQVSRSGVDSRGSGLVRLGPVYTCFVTMRLTRTPTLHDRTRLANALLTVESVYPFATSGVFTHISHGIPYFDRLPGECHENLVAHFMPRVGGTRDRYCLDETLPARAQHERNDILLTLRSDSVARIGDVLCWLTGDNDRLGGRSVGACGLRDLLRVTTRRFTFRRRGLPRELAHCNHLPFADRVPASSEDWLGAGTAQNDPDPQRCTCAGSPTVSTSASAGGYFDNASILHLAHVILHPERWYRGVATGLGAQPSGHHLSHGGAGLDALDIPDRTQHPKWHLCVFGPTAPVHTTPEPAGTTTRAQNFLTPPRRHRAFPLLEFRPPRFQRMARGPGRSRD